MTAQRFSPAEVDLGGRSLLPVARALEAYAARTPAPSSDLVVRIMAAVPNGPAIRLVPAPTSWALFSRALRGGSIARAAAELANAMGTSLSVGRSVPLAVRAQAIALVVTVALVVGGGGAVFASGAAAIVDAIRRPPAAAPAVPALESRPAPGAGGSSQKERPHGKPNAGRGRGHGAKGSPAGHATPKPAKPRPGAGAGVGAGGKAEPKATNSPAARDDRDSGTPRGGSSKTQGRSRP